MVAAAASSGSVNAVLIKPNQAGTLTRARAAFDAAQRGRDDRDRLCPVGRDRGHPRRRPVRRVGADGVKVGSITRGERTAKWNRLLQIEEDLAARATYAGWSALGKVP